MNWVDKIREQHIDTLMQQLAAKPHRKRIMHLNDIGSIGLVVQCQSDKDKLTISQFHTLLKKRGTTLRIIEPPSNKEEQTDKYGLPKMEYLQPFIKYHYDLLIDAVTDGSLFGPFVTLNTSSNLRVGYSNEGKARPADGSAQPPATTTPERYRDIYDLLILGNEEFELSRYLPNILEYLIQIRKTD